MKLRLGSGCTGYGGLDLAAEAVLGPLQHVWHAETDAHASKVLAAHWPGTRNIGDLTTVDWATVPPVDVFTAGFPCQDVSAAGKRAGLTGDKVIPAGIMDCGCPWADHQPTTCTAEDPDGGTPQWRAANDGIEYAERAVEQLNEQDRDDDGPPPERIIKGTRTGVWTAIARGIRELRPKLVLLENVRGLLNARANSDVEPCPWCLGNAHDEPVLRALGAVLADLADLGFDAEWSTVPASAVGAPHRRERVFIVAWPADSPPDARDIAGRMGIGTAAADGVTLLPTPRTNEARGVGKHGTGGPDLRTVVSLLPTPRGRDSKGRDPNPRGVDLNEAVALLPTPNAALGRGTGTPSQETATRRMYEEGRRFLDDAVALLPTPRVAATRTGRSAILGSSSAPSLDQAIELASGEVPRELRSLDEAPASWRLLPTPRSSNFGQDEDPEVWSARNAEVAAGRAKGASGMPLGVALRLLPTPLSGDSRDTRSATVRRSQPRGHWTLSDVAYADRWGAYAPVIQRWEYVTGRPAPNPTELGMKGQSRLAPVFVEWMMGLPAGWVTALLARNAALRCLGNGVVWQQAAYAYRGLLRNLAR